VNAGNTTRRNFLLRTAATTVAFSIGSSGSSIASPAPKKRPNIVLILADDLGYCDSELYGCDTIPTPNIKRIADDGVLCTEGYVTSPVCSPSRAGLLTGRYQQRYGHEFLPSDNSRGLPRSETTLADALRQFGYTTGLVGKWHLGVGEEFNPIHRGFDEFFGVAGPASDYIDPTREDVKSSRPDRETAKAPKSAPAATWEGRGKNAVMRGTQPVEEEQYLTDAFTREAVAFINNHRSRPFFLYVPYTAPHQPLQVTQKYYNRFPHIDDESTRIYAAMISSMDDGIGSILDALEENRLEKNTLVIFLSDNGAGVADYCSNRPLRLGKQTLFEGGIRVPFCMKWPGQIPEGTTCEHPVSALDIFPTAVAAAGGDPSTKNPGDGVDLLPYLKGTISDRPHDMLFWRSSPNWAVRIGNWKLIHAGDRDWLYNLNDDIGEQSNLAAEQPEMVKKLKNAYDRWNSEMIEPLWPPMGVKASPQFAVDGVAIDWPV